ncbi:MAG: adenylate/guanylate cyclase domain-containing protein [Desulfobacteraceae bacterium]
MFNRTSVAWCCICLGMGLIGIFGGLLPVLSDAEENLGLHWLYQVRGPEKPPADVVVVAIDRESAKAFKLPAVAHKWPRILHARLLDRLTAEGAAVVAFDLIFHEPKQTSHDQAFAAAIRRAGNVILTQPIDRQTLPLNGLDGSPVARVNIEKTVSAIPLFADEVLVQAPFPLPKMPVKLNQYWRFRPGAGDLPSLPVVVMHAFATDAFDTFIGLLKKVDPSAAATLPAFEDEKHTARQIIQTIRPIYQRFKIDPTLVGRMMRHLEHDPRNQSEPQSIGLVKAYISIYGSGKSQYLNLYGPPGTIETISYHLLLDPGYKGTAHRPGTLPTLKGKAVFVGQTESDWFKVNDGFYTAFTGESGVDISGVEIAATAFANLLEDKAVYPLGPKAHCAVLLFWGILVALISLRFSTSISAAGILLLNGMYIGMACLQFKSGGVWYPLVVPLLVQTPAAFISGLVWKYSKANAERSNIRKAFGHYLPQEVVNQLAANVKELNGGGKVLYSICLLTDAESYTPLSESLDPENLTHLMNTYYGAIFKPIKANKGQVLQVVGDSVLAIWSAPQPDNDLKSAACRSAIGISKAVRQFNETPGHHPLPTRIGLHAGEILLGNIGAMDHFEYRPVGDIVNTASRLEGLNKYLGTRMLASEEIIIPGNACPTRPVGQFVFKGKSKPVRVYEILPENGLSSELQTVMYRLFASGLRAFGHRCWDEADQYFRQALQINPKDGPSQFYLRLCRQYRNTPPEYDWDGAIRLDHK